MASVLQTIANVLDQVRFEVGRDSNTLSDTNLLRSANKWFLWVVRELMDGNEDVYGEISTSDLVSGQREYSLPADDAASTYGGGLVRPLRAEVTYDGTNWYVMKQIDMQQLQVPLNETDIASYYSKTDPHFAYFDRSLWLFPRPTSTDSVTAGNAGLRIFWLKRPNELATSTVPDFPKDFLNVLAAGIRSDALNALGRPSEANNSKEEFFTLLNRAKALETDVFEPFVLKRGFERWDS